MDNYYNEISESYDELHGSEQVRKLSLVKQFITGKILDVGCGTGIVWKEYKNMRVSECENVNLSNVTGIEPSKKLLERAKHIKTILGNGERLPFPNDFFDTVTCFTAIHNFNDYKKGLDEMKRVSKNIVIVTVLKKSEKRKRIGGEMKKMFKNITILDDETDDIYLCKKNNSII